VASDEVLPTPQNHLRCFALRKLVDQLIQVANLPHCGLFDVLHPDTTNHSFDQSPRRIQVRRFCEVGFNVCSFLELDFELFLVIARQPTNDFVDFCFRASLSLCPSKTMAVYAVIFDHLRGIACVADQHAAACVGAQHPCVPAELPDMRIL
jgi:hypothetical protein